VPGEGVTTEVAFVWLECSVSGARSGRNDGMGRKGEKDRQTNRERERERERDGRRGKQTALRVAISRCACAAASPCTSERTPGPAERAGTVVRRG